MLDCSECSGHAAVDCTACISLRRSISERVAFRQFLLYHQTRVQQCQLVSLQVSTCVHQITQIPRSVPVTELVVQQHFVAINHS